METFLNVPPIAQNPGSVDEGSYEDYLLKEVIPYIGFHYSTSSATQESRYIVEVT